MIIFARQVEKILEILETSALKQDIKIVKEETIKMEKEILLNGGGVQSLFGQSPNKLGFSIS